MKQKKIKCEVMGNAIDEVKEKADIVIGSNDEDGIADFIESECIICN